MTKREYREAHRLTDREKAQIWNEIREPFVPQRHRRSWAPALGGLAAAACALAAILILTNDDGRGPVPAPTDVAVVPSEQPAAAPPVVGQRGVAPGEARREASPEPEPQMMKSARGGDALVASEATARLDEETRPVAAGGVLRGVVRDAETGAPLAFANVVLAGTTRSTATDSLGVFEFAGLEPGAHTVQVLYLGYALFEQTLTVADADTAEIQVALHPGVEEPLVAYDVEAARLMAEVKNATGDRDVGTETVERYAIGSVNDALSQESAGVVMTGQASVRGGRSGEVQSTIDGKSAPAPTVGAESGGTRNPNDRPYDLVYHEHYGVNPFVATEDDALSTFAIEVDDASWTVARRYLTDGHLPPAAAVRLEEIVNRLDPGLDHTGRDDFSLHADGMPSRFGPGYQLVRVGVRARDVAAAERRPAHLVFVIDISGSMDRENRLGLVKRALRVLVDELQEGDRVGIVVYGSNARMVLEPTGIENRAAILSAIDGLHSGGSTNAEAGLRMAYAMAREDADRNAINRLILCSDGVANVGNTGADSILKSVRREADQGTSLTTIGFGMGNYNDVMMEQLADQGDGTYHYVQLLEDAERVFRQNLTGTLQTVGAEVKTQVEFDPASVARWRLLGYENRDVRDEDFRNDSIDAGEIGAGHTAVALYEIKLTSEAARDLERGRDRELGTLRLRWAKPRFHDEAGQVTEIDRKLTTRDLATSWDAAPARLRAAAVAAEFAEILRKNYWAQESSLSDLVDPVTRLVSELPADQDILDLSRMIHRAAALASRDGAPRPTTDDD